MAWVSKCIFFHQHQHHQHFEHYYCHHYHCHCHAVFLFFLYQLTKVNLTESNAINYIVTESREWNPITFTEWPSYRVCALGGGILEPHFNPTSLSNMSIMVFLCCVICLLVRSHLQLFKWKWIKIKLKIHFFSCTATFYLLTTPVCLVAGT